jgi:Tripartite tricarboxylate transporter TctB family
LNSPVRNPRDFWTGLIFMAVGIAFIVNAQDYPFGSARKMGPGYFPILLAGLLIIIGLAMTVRELVTSGAPVGSFAIKPMLMVTIGTVVFGLAVRWAGLAPAVLVLVLVSAWASQHFRLRAGALLAIGLAAFCALVFVYGLGLPMPVFGPLFGG